MAETPPPHSQSTITDIPPAPFASKTFRRGLIPLDFTEYEYFVASADILCEFCGIEIDVVDQPCPARESGVCQP